MPNGTVNDTAYSLRDVFEAFTYGHGNLSLPVYMANFMFDVFAALFPIFILILMGTTAYKMMKQGDMKRQIREQAVYMSVIILGVYFAISIPGIHTYNNKPTYLLIDAYASVLKKGEDLADALTYNILFNSGIDSTYKPGNPPNVNTELKGFFENQNEIEKIFDPSRSSAQRAQLLKEYRKKSINGHLALSAPIDSTPFQKLAYLNSFVLTKSHHISYYEKLIDPDALNDPEKLDDENRLIIYGDPNIYGDAKTFVYNGRKSFRDMLFFSGGRLKPVHKYVEEILQSYVTIVDGLISNFRNYTNINPPKSDEEKEYFKDYLLTLQSIKAAYMTAINAVNVVKQDGAVVDSGKINSYFEKLEGKIKHFKWLFNWHKQALSRLVNGVPGNDETGLVAISKYIQAVQDDFKNNKVDFSIDQLNHVIEMWVDTVVSFNGIANGSFVAVNVPDSPYKNMVIESLYPAAYMFKVISFDFSPRATKREVDAMIHQAVTNGMENYNTLVDISEAFNSLDSSRNSASHGKTLNILSDERLGGDRNANQREISWVDLGYYYAVLKNYYAEKIIYKTYLAVEDLYTKALYADMEEINKRIAYADEARKYIKSNSDFEKIEKTRDLGTAAFAIGGAAKSIVNSVSDVMSPRLSISKAFSLLKVGTAVFKAAISAGVDALMAWLLFSVVLNLVYVMLPAFLWMLAVIAWFFKTAVMIALLPLNIFLAFFESKQQAIKSMMFNLLGQALVPVTMVIIFFIVIVFSIELELMIDRFIPMLNKSALGIGTAPSMWGVGDAINNGIDSIVGKVIEFVKMFILLLINTQLYMQFFKADDYVSEVIGERVSYGQTISGSEIMNKMMIGKHV